MKYILSALVAFLVWPALTYAATLSFSAPTVVPVGTEFSLTVYASSIDRGFNAAEATISFPEEILEVVSINTTAASTIFNFWLALPSFSNEEGKVIFSGGTTNGVLGSDIPILTVHMRAKGIGVALITASDASVNASDGSGTNILEDILALRFAVPDATVVVPPKPAMLPPLPDPMPAEKPAAPSPAATSSEVAACTGLFINCEIRFPKIESVSILPHQQSGSDFLVSGTAPEGTHVHLLLRRDGIFYKEIQAIVQPDRTWKGLFDNIYVYGTYSIDARAESIKNRASQPVTWPDISIYPPYTLHALGFVVRWHIVATALLSLLLFLFGLLTLRHLLLLTRRKKRPTPFIVPLCIVSIIASIAMSAATYLLWQKEYTPEATYWKDTAIPCINREHSYTDTYRSLQLIIIIDDKPQTIPVEIGVSPQCVAQIHTHDDTGHLHFESTERMVTLPDFFAVAGITLEREGYVLAITVNEEEYTGRISTYNLQNNDVVVVTYTSSP